ncbi:hypothetical protein M3182_25030 [Mesobacillus maritimus]|nr:hypothetical protein [Mesobacillus maritimus]MCM3588892.1 hypothetical protein [Mesobacillus maritimus]
MPKIIEFKSQKDINKDRQEKLDLKKAEIRRRVDALKTNQKHRPEKVKA